MFVSPCGEVFVACVAVNGKNVFLPLVLVMKFTAYSICLTSCMSSIFFSRPMMLFTSSRSWTFISI